MKKRILAALICAAMLATLLMACGTSGDSSSGDSSGTTQTGSSGNGGDGREREVITLKAFKDSPPNPDNWMWGDDMATQWITENLGIRIDVEYAVSTDSTQLMTMLASGEKLPDIISVPMESPARRLMVQQGFAAPLNVLADTYYTAFWDVLPMDIDSVFRESDGNFYALSDFYGAPDRLDEGDLARASDRTFNIMVDLYSSIGSPDISTWEGFVAALEQVREQNPDMGYILYDHHAMSPDDSASLIDILARMNGARNRFYQVNADNSLTFLPRATSYKAALKELNSLVRKGLFNPENFTHPPWSEVSQQILGQQDFFAFIGAHWMSYMSLGFPEDMILAPIDFPIPAAMPRNDFVLWDSRYGLGYNAMYVSADTEYPEDVMRFITWLLTDEGQMMWRFGFEGVSFEFDANGVPEYTAEFDEVNERGAGEVGRVYGINNYNWSFIPQNWIFDIGSRGVYVPMPGAIECFEIYLQYAHNERLSDLTWALSGEDELLMRAQIVDLWRNAVPQIAIATSDDAFEAAYERFMSDLDRVGVAEFESMLTANRDAWISRGLAPDR